MTLIKPHRPEAEKAVIKCLLQNPELYYEANKELNTHAFFHNENAIVFGALKKLIEQSQTPDQVVLIDELKHLGQFDTIGGQAYFEHVAATETLEANYQEYVEQVYDSYIRREVISAGKRISEGGYSHDANQCTDLIFNESERIFKLANQGITDAAPIDELMLEEFEAFLERMKNPGAVGMPTKFDNYDLLTGGLEDSEQIIIAARPSTGKTALALRLMLNLSEQGYPCAFFSYEMSKSQLMQRLMSMWSRVNMAKIKTGRISEVEYEAIAQAANKIKDLPIYLNYDPIAPVSEVVNESRRLIRKYGVKVVLVDYLQLMPHRMEFATQELGNITRRLKVLATSSNIVSILVSQLNRQVEQRTEKRPLLSDLRQSGNIEEHADVVLMLFREEMYFPNQQNKGQAEVLIRKNRNGPIGMIPMHFEASNVDFRGI